MSKGQRARRAQEGRQGTRLRDRDISRVQTEDMDIVCRQSYA